MKEMTGSGLEETRDTIVTAAHSLIGTKNVQRLLVSHKAQNKQIKLAIIVIVEPDGAGGPPRRGDSGFISHICERTIAVIAIKNIAAITGDIEINPTIAIVIAGGDAHPKRAAGHSGFVSHVRERAIVVVMVKSIPERSIRSKEI